MRKSDLRLRQGNIDGGRVKDRPSRDEDNLDHEAAKGERVVVEDDAADVANHLNQTAKDHKRHEPPASPLDAEKDVDCTGNGKEDEKGDVGRQGGPVLVDAPFDRAQGEGAVGIGAKGDEVVWQRWRRGCRRHGWCMVLPYAESNLTR